MKIRIINPDYGVGEENMRQRCAMLQPYVGPDVELSMVCLTKTHVEIDSAADVVLAGPEILELAIAAEKEGCDAVVLYCFSDPAAEACKERLHIPVIGGAQASLLTVPLVGKKAGILLADRARIEEKELFVRTLGLAPERIGTVAAIDFHGRSIWDNREQAYQELKTAGEQLLQKQPLSCLVLGCLSFLGMAKPLSKELGVPVIDPAICAVCTAESLVRQELI